MWEPSFSVLCRQESDSVDDAEWLKLFIQLTGGAADQSGLAQVRLG